MSIARFTSDTLVGKLLRLPLRLVPRSAVVCVCKGPLRGARWVVGSSTHGCWLGTYEADKPERIARAISAGSVVYDIGANAGYYTLLGSRCVGDRGRVIAFEPHPANIAWLRRHAELNRAANVTIVQAAVAGAGGTARFRTGPTLAMGSLGAEGEFEVDVVSIDEQVQAGAIPPPAVVKMDVEGAEYDALRGARETLARYRPAIFLSTHGPEVHRASCELLRELGYSLESFDERPLEATDEVVARPA